MKRRHKHIPKKATISLSEMRVHHAKNKTVRSTLETQGTTRITNYKTRLIHKVKENKNSNDKVSKCLANISALGVQNVMV